MVWRVTSEDVLERLSNLFVRPGVPNYIRSDKGSEFAAKSVRTPACFPYRDLDEAAGLTESAAMDLFDFRTGSNICHSMTALLRQSIYSRLAGYEDVNDAERLSVDPVMRHIVGGRAADSTPPPPARWAASRPTC